MLDSYHLSKDDFDAAMEFELLTGANAKAAYAAVPTAAKSALTRKYNAAHLAMKKTSSSKGGVAMKRFTEDGEEEEGDDGEDDGDEEEATEAVQKPAAAKGKGKGKARV